MKYLLIILLFSFSFCEGQNTVQFGASRPSDTSLTKGSIKIGQKVIIPLYSHPDSSSNYMKVDATGNIYLSNVEGTGTGSVTHVGVNIANGFNGAVLNPTSTPQITIGTTVTANVLKASGGALVAAISGVDYQPAGRYVDSTTLADSTAKINHRIDTLHTNGGITISQVDSAAKHVTHDTATLLKIQLTDSVIIRELLANKVQNLNSPNANTYISTAGLNTVVSFLIDSDKNKLDKVHFIDSFTTQFPNNLEQNILNSESNKPYSSAAMIMLLESWAMWSQIDTAYWNHKLDASDSNQHRGYVTLDYYNTHLPANIDTTSLSNRINTKIPYTDTSAYLITQAKLNTQINADTASLSNRINLKTTSVTPTINVMPIFTSATTMGNSNIIDTPSLFHSYITDSLAINGLVWLKNVPAAVNSDNILVLGSTKGTVRYAPFPTGTANQISVTWPGNVFSFPNTDISIGSHKLINVSTPTLSTDATNKAYVDNIAASLNPAVAVQATTTANVPGYTYNNGASGVGATLTQTVASIVVIDGYTLLLNDRVLFKNQSTAANNGVYFISTLGTGLIPAVFTRSLDYNQPSDINNTGAIPVVNGTVNAVTSWLLTSSVATVGTDPLTYIQFSANPVNNITTSTAAGGSLGGTYPNPTVVTNANLTGPIASSGNATSIASQTGTGTTFVMSVSPTLSNPSVGTQGIGDSSTFAASTAFIKQLLATPSTIYIPTVVGYGGTQTSNCRYIQHGTILEIWISLTGTSSTTTLTFTLPNGKLAEYSNPQITCKIINNSNAAVAVALPSAGSNIITVSSTTSSTPAPFTGSGTKGVELYTKLETQ